MKADKMVLYIEYSCGSSFVLLRICIAPLRIVSMDVPFVSSIVA